MKRGLALLCAMALLLMSAAQPTWAIAEETAVTETEEMTEGTATETAGETAEEEVSWREGMGPSKPYAGVPEVDLSKQLGYMIFFPAKTRTTKCGCKKLFIYLPRTDVKAGEGTFYLASESAGELWRTAMNNESAVKVRALLKSEMKSLMWAEGTCFEITLPKSLAVGESYFVNLERGCIVTEDDKLSNPAVGGTDMWAFTLEGDYGVSNMEYRRPLNANGSTTGSMVVLGTDANGAAIIANPAADDSANAGETIAPEIEYETGILTPLPGDNIRFDLVLGGDAAMAVLYGYFNSVDFPMTMYQESCEVTGTVLTDTPFWGVMFLDAQGNELYRTEFR